MYDSLRFDVNVLVCKGCFIGGIVGFLVFFLLNTFCRHGIINLFICCILLILILILIRIDGRLKNLREKNLYVRISGWYTAESPSIMKHFRIVANALNECDACT